MRIILCSPPSCWDEACWWSGCSHAREARERHQENQWGMSTHYPIVSHFEIAIIVSLSRYLCLPCVMIFTKFVPVGLWGIVLVFLWKPVNNLEWLCTACRPIRISLYGQCVILSPLSQSLINYRKEHQRIQDRREFDLYDPDSKKKDLPARVSDEDPRLTVSGITLVC